MEARVLPQSGIHPAANGSLNLRARRAERGLTLEQIAESTKISIYFLRAIENEQFHLLPGGIFTTSYLRQYAEAAGCAAGDLLDAAGVQRELPEDRPSRGAGLRSRLMAGLLRVM